MEVIQVQARMHNGVPFLNVNGIPRSLGFVMGAYEPDWLVWCSEHKHFSRAIEQGSNAGFSGAPIYWAHLACGGDLFDASADTLAYVG